MAFEKHLLVDGANVLNAWPEFRALLKRDRDSARSQLIQRLGAVHDVEAIRVTLVIDGRGKEVVVEHPSAHATFSVIYTPSSLTADDVIEQIVGRSADASTCEVATADRAERETVQSLGAVSLSPEELERRIERAEQRLATKVAGINRTNAQEWRTRSHE